MHHLTKSLARELAPKRITVNVIAPGFVPSKMSAGLANYGADKEAMNKNIPLGRMGKFSLLLSLCLDCIACLGTLNNSFNFPTLSFILN